MSKHTPGPWMINKYGGIGAGQFGINPCIVDSQGWSDGNGADISLIAAAPDLLEALKAMCEFWAYGLSQSEGAVPTEQDEARVVQLAEMAAAAIQKAEGAP